MPNDREGFNGYQKGEKPVSTRFKRNRKKIEVPKLQIEPSDKRPHAVSAALKEKRFAGKIVKKVKGILLSKKSTAEIEKTTAENRIYLVNPGNHSMTTLNGYQPDADTGATAAGANITGLGMGTMVGSPRFNNDTGMVEVVLENGLTTSTFNLSGINPSNGFRVVGNTTGDFFGTAIIGTTDVTGDGIPDLVATAINALDYAGQVIIVPGGQNFQGILDLSNLTSTDVEVIVIDGEPDSCLGWTVGASDVDGDSIGDIAVGAPCANEGAGRIYLIRGRQNWLVWPARNSLADLANVTRFNGEEYPNFASVVAKVGADINNDGKNDLCMGAEDKGYCYFGRLAEEWPSDVELGTLNDGINGFTFLGPPGSGVGEAIVHGNILGNDDIPDVCAGGSQYESEKGITICWRGRTTWPGVNNYTDGIIIEGENPGDGSGTALTTAEGHVVIGAPNANSGRGAVYFANIADLPDGSMIQLSASNNTVIDGTDPLNSTDIKYAGIALDSYIGPSSNTSTLIIGASTTPDDAARIGQVYVGPVSENLVPSPSPSPSPTPTPTSLIQCTNVLGLGVCGVCVFPPCTPCPSGIPGDSCSLSTLEDIQLFTSPQNFSLAPTPIKIQGFESEPLPPLSQQLYTMLVPDEISLRTKAMGGAAAHGTLRGACEVMKQFMCKQDIAADTIKYTTEITYLACYGLASFMQHYQNQNEADDTFNRIYQAAITAGSDTLWLFLAAGVCKQVAKGSECATKYVDSRGWTRTARAVSFFGQHVSNLVYSRDVVEEGMSTTALKVASGMMAEKAVAYLGNKALSLGSEKKKVENNITFNCC